MTLRACSIRLLLAFVCGSLCLAAPAAADNPGVSGAPIRLACVGDSITAGAGAPKGKAYPAQLQGLLGAGWDVKNFGRSGATMLRKGDRPYWKDKSFPAAQAFQPNIVVIMLGTNDSKPKNWIYENEFVSDYRNMVQTFQALATKPHIYICHVPTVVEPNKYNISETNSIVIDQQIDALAKEMGLEVIPMDQAYGGDNSVLGTDLVHPDEKGALELAQTVAKVLKASAPAAQ